MLATQRAFIKPSLTLSCHLSLLQERGLNIDDLRAAMHNLKYI